MDAKNACHRLPFLIIFIFLFILSGCGGGEKAVPEKSTAPTFTSASITTNEDTESAGVGPKVIDPSANDSHTFTINIQPSHGTASIVSNQLVYMPESEYSGNDSFSFTATDNQGQSVTGNATVTVTSINDAPVSTSASISTNEGISGGTTPTVVDIDPGDTHTFTVTIQGTKGTASVVDNQLVYTPDNAAFGDDSFTYIATDSGGLSVAGNASVNIIRNAPSPSTLSLSFGIKQLQFSWPVNSSATHYQLMENPDGVSSFTQVGADITDTSVNINISVFLHDWNNARYLLKTCNQSGCVDSNQVVTSSDMLSAIGQLKASNKAITDKFGSIVSLSNDGLTLAVSAVEEDSISIGINNDETDNNAAESGAVYIFVYDGSNWNQQAYIKASNTDATDYFGSALHLSGDGNTLVVGAPSENSNAQGINGDQTDDSIFYSGAAYVYTRSGNTWSQQAYIKGSNTDTQDRFGAAVKLSDDGNTLAIGAEYEDSTSAGIDSVPTESASWKGAVYVFIRSANTWSEQAYIKQSNNNATAYEDYFGAAISLSADGNTLAVGARTEDSNAKGINGADNDNAVMSGAVYIFTRSVNTWIQQSYIKSSNSEERDAFGSSLSLSSDGNTLAVGALEEDSFATGINGDQTDNNASNAGAVYVFFRQNTNWTQQTYLKASNTQIGMGFGRSVTLSADGNRLAIAAHNESSNATGINGNQNNTDKWGSGAVYVFDRANNNSAWSQTAYVKAKVSVGTLYFGASTSFSSDGNVLAVGGTGDNTREGSAFLY